jgi:MFS family permease
MVAPGVASSFLPYGLRPEPLAVALIMCGLVLCEFQRRRLMPLFAGFFLLALGTAAAPRTAPFGAAFFLLAAIRAFRTGSREGGHRRAFAVLAAGLGGLLVAALLFLWLLDFRLLEFLKDFRMHSQRVAHSRWYLVGVFFSRYLGITQWPTFLLFGVLLGVYARPPWRLLNLTAVIVAAGFVALALIGGLGDGNLWFAVFALLALAAEVAANLQTKAGQGKWVLPALVIGALSVANIKTLLNIAGIVAGTISRQPGQLRTEALSLRPLPNRPVLVDESVARYVFDYRLPPGTVYWPFAAPFPMMLPIDVAIAEDDVYLLGPNSVDILRNSGLLDTDPAKWVVLLKRWSFYRHPREVYIIPAGDCAERQKKQGPLGLAAPRS